MSSPFFLNIKPIKKEKEDLLNFFSEVGKIEKLLNYFNLFLIVGKEGSGKTSFLNLIKSYFSKEKKVNLVDSTSFFKKTKKLEGELILIDDFEELCLLDEKELLPLLKSIKNKKLIISCNISKLKSWNKDNEKQLIFSFLSDSDYVIKLETFYTQNNLKKLVNEFELILRDKFGIELSDEERDILFFVVNKKFKFDLRKIKKFFLSLYVQLELAKEENKEIKELKTLIPKDFIISYMWDKELSKSDKVNIEKVFSQNMIKKQEKKEEIMDINSLINKYQKEDSGEERVNIEEVIKNHPNLIDEGVIISDYMENMVYKGISLSELTKQKPKLIGYKNDKLYLIYIYEDLRSLPLKELNNLGEDYEKLKKEGIDLVITTLNTEENRKIIEELNLHKNFKIILV
jgi:energy-coupling factor transporter ATP-binding protein EcfA2